MPDRKSGTIRKPSAKTVKARSGAAASARKRSTAARSPEGPDTAFVDALSLDFIRHGATAIARVREDDPVTYMKLCASVLPKSIIGSIDPLEALSDEQLHDRARQLAAKVRLGSDPDVERAGPAK